jgi:N-acyl-L-homoserine lactone synthetase
MGTQTCRKQVTAVADECVVVVANTPELREEVFRLRYQVYCVERAFEPGCDGKEFDEFDSRAGHVLLVHRASGDPIGTVRVIPPSPTAGLRGLPMSSICAPGLLRHLPPLTTGEISRFAVSKQRRLSCQAGAMVRLGLMQGVLRLSVELGLTDWCAIMEPTLLRLQRMNAIYFSPLGPLVEHHGLRQPSCGNIDNVLHRIRSEQPDVWDYLTLGGTLRRPQVPVRLVA